MVVSSPKKSDAVESKQTAPNDINAYVSLSAASPAIGTSTMAALKSMNFQNKDV
jgi:hypothetical protein